MVRLWTRTLLAGVGVAAAGALLVGCSDGTAKVRRLPEAEKGAPASAGGATSASPVRGSEAVAAYRAMWHDLNVASETSDASSSLLNDHARGDAIALMKYGLKKAKAEGVVGKGRVRLAPEVVEATGDKVTLRDCVDGTRWLQYRLDGRLKDDIPGSHRKADATVEKVSGNWRVSRFYLYKAGSC